MYKRQGKDIALDLLADAGLPKKEVKDRYDDCGAMIFEKEQDTHSGGSGCGCSASVFAGYVYKRLQRGTLRRVLIMSTGALLSTVSPFQMCIRDSHFDSGMDNQRCMP